MKKKRKIRINKNFPEGAISGAMIDKVSAVYLSRMLEDGGAEDLMHVITPFSEGKIFEYVGQMNNARDTFKKILKKNPKNRWAIEALSQVEMNIN